MDMEIPKSSLKFRGDVLQSVDAGLTMLPQDDDDIKTMIATDDCKNEELKTHKFTGILSPDDPEFQKQMDGSTKYLNSGQEAASDGITLVWGGVFTFTVLHIGALYGLFLALTEMKENPLLLYLKGYLISFFMSFGVTVGAHRYWTHRSFKAKTPLRIILLFLQTMSGQKSIYTWVREHRVHHKFTETTADPHDIRRGFFFAHIGWLLCKKHPDVIKYGKLVDLSDLKRDPLVMWQYKYYLPLAAFFVMVIPTTCGMYLGAKSWYLSFWIYGVLRYAVGLHYTFLINSAAHMWGNKPYDKFMSSCDNLFFGILDSGEGWHNYHHVFPWDYKISELGFYKYNFGTMFIDFFAWIGWAYDLKTVSPEIVEKRTKRTGDGSHPVWGWGDKDATEEQIKDTIRIKQN